MKTTDSSGITPSESAGKPFTCSITGCARCGGEGHVDVCWQPLTYPIEHDDGDWTHWAPCPTNSEPILMRAAVYRVMTVEQKCS